MIKLNNFSPKTTFAATLIIYIYNIQSSLLSSLLLPLIRLQADLDFQTSKPLI